MAGESTQTEKKLSIKTFECPSCGSSLKVRAVGETLVVACGSCGSVIDVTNDNYKIIDTAKENTKIRGVIPLGTRGKVRGDVYEVIGFMRRSDASGMYHWSEYLLYSPFKGFHWLMEAYGHWNFISMTKNKPSYTDGEKAVFLNETYRLFYKGFSKVTYVLGEFYWKVKIGSQSEVLDYVCPPRILSQEKDAGEIIWSLGEYVEPDAIKDAFKITMEMPQQTGVAPNQPSNAGVTLKKMAPYLAFFVIGLVMVQMATVMTSKNQQVFGRSYQYDQFATTKTITTEKFQLAGGSSDLEVHLQSPVQNNWFGVDVSLINDTTGESFDFDQGVEYYYGVDGGESWSEGDTQSNVVLSSIPGGTYYMTIDPSSGGVPAGHRFDISVVHDVPLWSNFLEAFALILIFPLFAFWRRRSFEVKRWSESDFSPYESGDDT